MKLSATSIATFKACPMQYYYKYILGLVPDVEHDALRIGTNWHRIQEISSMTPGAQCECVEGGPHVTKECPICEGTGVIPDDLFQAVIRHLNKAYAVCPPSKELEEWDVERITLLYLLFGYQWYYNDEAYEVQALEQNFDEPLRSPKTNRALQTALIGKIDRLFSCGNNQFVHEYKTTSKSLDPDSTYWGHLTLDTQTRLYTLVAQELGLGLCGVLYDVTHKPQIKPKKLTQADSKRFAEDGEYCGQTFITAMNQTRSPGDYEFFKVNGVNAEVTPGAKEGTFAIKETPDMFGARLLQDIAERPEFYFARREVAHNQADIDAFRWELVNIYTSIRQMKNSGCWWRNEHTCEATFKCPYIDFCYNHRNIGEDEVPDGFKKRGGK